MHAPSDSQNARRAALDAASLRARMQGEVAVPGDASYDAARQAWNLTADQRPAIVAVPRSAADVAAAVRFATRHGLRVAPQSTGHNALPLGPLHESLLLKMHELRDVEIDPVARTARVGAGAIWVDVTVPAHEHGLAALGGSSPDVGVAGYALGGGLSWLARRYGLCANTVRALEVVTADGRLRRVDHQHEPDLFWALRGGGGSFGAVTAIELELFPIREVYAGTVFFPIERADEVLRAWRQWIDTVPDEMTSVGRLLRIPPLPMVPEPLRGRDFVVVEAIYAGPQAEGEPLVAPLRALGAEIDTFAMIPAPMLQKLHMDPEGPTPGSGDGILLDDLPREGLDAFLAAANPPGGTPLVSVELRQLGGAVARRPEGAGVVGSFDAGFALFAVGITPTPDALRAVQGSVRQVIGAMAPWAAPQAYSNFVEEAGDTRRLFPAESFARLQAVKAAYDPRDTFQSNHPVPLPRADEERAAA